MKTLALLCLGAFATAAVLPNTSIGQITVEPETIKFQWDISQGTDNRSERIFFDEYSNPGFPNTDAWGFSLIFAGRANPVFNGSPFPLAENTFNILRHDDDVFGKAALSIDRKTGLCTLEGLRIRASALGTAAPKQLLIESSDSQQYVSIGNQTADGYGSIESVWDSTKSPPTPARLWLNQNGGPVLVGSDSYPGSLLVRGKATVTGEAWVKVLHITGGGDIAEPFDVTGDLQPVPGMVVSIDPAHAGQLRVSQTAYDSTVAGIVSGANGVNPGMMLEQRGTAASGRHPIALTGRVYGYADADAGGAINPGDLLTTSPTPGHAMRAKDRERAGGALIGKAMSRLPSGKGLVLILVSLQ